MRHTIPVETLGPGAESMALAVEKCVHCGFCLPACPTYNIFGEEMDSPRGRIVLMKSVLEGAVELEEALPYVDRCLGCLGCVPACPSGVAYGELVTPFRAFAQERRRQRLIDRLARQVVLEMLPYPRRFRLVARLGRLAKPLAGLLPERFAAMLDLLPQALPASAPLPQVFPAQGQRRARVALLAGCVQQVLEPEINWATLRVLARNGVEVVVPRKQGCCGALAMHTGAAERARAAARRNFAAFPQDVDAILSNAAGCGSGMREYPLLFQGRPSQGRAQKFSARVQDVSAFVDALGLLEPPALPGALTLAYQDACHLAHAQGISAEPRRLLGSISGLSLEPIAEAELCCGSAGSYNIDQPEAAAELGRRKATRVLETGAEGVVSGNIGCMLQIRTHLARLGRPLPVWHTMQVLDHAYRGCDGG